MTPKRGGEKVAPGLYWCRNTWEIVPISGKPATLPGPEGYSYWPIPTLAMLVMGPVLGGLFVVFLPFIGFALLLHALAKRGLQLATSRLSLIYSGRKSTRKPGDADAESNTAGTGNDDQRVA